MRPTCVSFGHPLAMTCACHRFARAQIRMKVDAHFSPFGHPIQDDTSWSQVICICVKSTAFYNLGELASRLAKSVNKFWFCKLSSTCESIWLNGSWRSSLKCSAWQQNWNLCTTTLSFVVVFWVTDLWACSWLTRGHLLNSWRNDIFQFRK